MANEPKIKPIGDRVLVKAIEVDEEIKGGIIIPDAAKEKPSEAEVVALGTGKEDDKPFFVKIGDRVIISKYGGTSIKYDDVEYTILREDDIQAIVG